LWLSIHMNTNQLTENIKRRFDHKQARHILRETYQAKMIFAHGGGMWRAGPDLLNLCKLCDGEVVLEDIYNTPVKVQTELLYTHAMQLWQEQMNAWHTEYEQVSKFR
jgi:hypothetical protein